METKAFEIRLCESCGLRYPLMGAHSSGTRCPHCLGETHAVLEREIKDEAIMAGRLKEGEPINISVLVDNVRSAWNVGSILRTADGFGFGHAYLCGITPTPEQESVQKTSLGAEDFVTWSHHKDAVKLVRGLKGAGWDILALEEDARAQPIDRLPQVTRNTVLVVGSEITGVDPGLLELSDGIFYIPMRGSKRSFNVAVAFGVAAWAGTHYKKVVKP